MNVLALQLKFMRLGTSLNPLLLHLLKKNNHVQVRDKYRKYNNFYQFNCNKYLSNAISKTKHSVTSDFQCQMKGLGLLEC